MTFLAIWVVVSLSIMPAAWSADSSVQDALRYRLEFDAADSVVTAAGEPIHALSALRRFYAGRMFRPAWMGETGSRTEALLEAIRDSADHGLEPADYHIEAIERLLAQRNGSDSSPHAGLHVDIELLLTDAFLLLGSHLHSGRLNPVSIEPTWSAQRPDVDLAGHLQEALENGHVRDALAALHPPQPRYRQLRAALARYRSVEREGGWPAIQPGPALKPGMENDRVPQLRDRLRARGDLTSGQAPPGSEALYGDTLESAVASFQERHGLDVDAVVGANTLKALNVPARDRVAQIRANLERWRWLPRELGDPHIEVNIAGYSMTVMEAGRSVLESEVIVGRNYRQTPLFSGRITYLVLSPFWEVPPNLARRDVLPRIKEDMEYLSMMQFDVLQGWGAEETRVDPAAIQWQSLSTRNFPYRLRQAPGPLNALGRVKFMFPNRHNVYIHDTPSRELFAESRRDFSSGCVRTNKPLELAAYLLESNGGWSLERVIRAVEPGSATQTLPLKQPVDVHLLYWSVWTDASGTVHFREDIYSRDGPLLEALNAPAPDPQTEIWD